MTAEPLRRIGLLCFICWAIFVIVAIRLEGVARTPENHLRLGVALAGTAVALFAVARAGAWPRLLYLACVGYFAYFAAGSAWYGLRQVAAVLADGPAETLALTFELAWRTVGRELDAGRHALALAWVYDLALMPLAQLAVIIHLARALLRVR